MLTKARHFCLAKHGSKNNEKGVVEYHISAGMEALAFIFNLAKIIIHQENWCLNWPM